MMQTTNGRRRRVLMAGTFLLALTATGLRAAPADQKENNGNPAILAAVQEVEDSVVSVQGAVSTVQDTVNTLNTKIDALGQPHDSSVRASAPVFAAGGVGAVGLACPVSNVSDVSHQVRIQLVAGAGVLSQQTITLPAGSTAQVVVGQGQGNVAYCKFVVLDGTRNDIRGAMTFGGGFTVNLVVPAD